MQESLIKELSKAVRYVAGWSFGGVSSRSTFVPVPEELMGRTHTRARPKHSGIVSGHIGVCKWRSLCEQTHVPESRRFAGELATLRKCEDREMMSNKTLAIAAICSFIFVPVESRSLMASMSFSNTWVERPLRKVSHVSEKKDGL